MSSDKTVYLPADRLGALRLWMVDQKVDAYLVTSADAHQSEDCPEHDRCLFWLSGFSGSLGRALVLQQEAVLFVDGRYQVQASKQIDPALWHIAHLHQTPPEKWIATQGEHSALRIGYDPMLWSVDQADALRASLKTCGAELIPLDDPFSAIWVDRPASPVGKVRAMPERLSGLSFGEKLAQIREELHADQIELWVESRPDEIAWLLNRRGSDVPMHPVPLSFAIIPSKGAVSWFIEPQKIAGDGMEGLDVKPFAPAEFLSRLSKEAEGKRVGFDPMFAPDAVKVSAESAGATLVPRSNPIMIRKARKTEAELKGYRDAHHADGIAWVEYCHWLSVEVPKRAAAGNPVTECEAGDKINQFRQAVSGYLEPSFKPISAVGPNAAMCHYNPTPGRDAPLLPGSLYLLDCGGQYESGTTDATRTFAFGGCPEALKPAATAVLRGFLSLSMATFPEGTFPHQLDALARMPLWQLGLDYDHGTGHGVGHNLLVHEYPHRLGKLPNCFGLEPGNIMTIEPGYYLEDGFGLRVENQVEVIAEESGFCSFRPLTLVPIDLALFSLDRLTQEEVIWLDAYHVRVREALRDGLSPQCRRWLDHATKPIAARGRE
ncbi:aminopeptidase P family protein [Cohaesibacter marisflavi]|uniref:aminopeptidase P family protein n=1 Tax=Cohaesibacter marisflavi TaxID=655353 RepID=UPI0029C6D98E|nr:aminopeptidase P family protein [Cohaesibacter marisflavi]